MNKVILKTALKTLLAVFIALAAAFGVLSLGFPQTMAGICEDLHGYVMATGYASLRYSYTKNADDLARCAEDSILSGKRANIINFCVKLTEHKDFESVCEKKDKATADGNGEVRYSYRQYIFGNLAIAQYAENDKAAALSSAEKGLEGTQGFPKNNSLAILAIRVAERQDFQTAQGILRIMGTVSPDGDAQREYYDAVKSVLTFEEN